MGVSTVRGVAPAETAACVGPRGGRVVDGGGLGDGGHAVDRGGRSRLSTAACMGYYIGWVGTVGTSRHSVRMGRQTGCRPLPMAGEV